MSHPKIVSGRSNPKFAEAVAAALNVPMASVRIKNFSDGEMWVKYDENIRGEDLFIIQSTNPPAENLLELLMLIDAARRASAKRITAVIPYFGYARQDRKDQPRVAITSKLIANLIAKAGADRVISMDLHAPQLQGFFDIPVDHLYASNTFVKHFKEQKIKKMIIASPDVGGTKMARAYAKRFNTDLIVIDKRRPAPNVAEVMNIIGDPKGKNVIMVDDLIDTAGTFTNAAVALKKAGANRIFGACTHAVLSGEAIKRIEDSPLESLIVADTIPLLHHSPKIRVQSVAKVFAEAIKRTHEDKSISSLFDT
ncbi:MAG: ribose-phosphate pyrophosphokinase [Bacteroidota bacterium]|nr:ribose-phosphate pyrophosphokinase [Bacteroidota bacterium]MDP4232819.1 ribose-phosphate pyrophosphokinase [Bacteroidota bacterium]MDP4242500.1 ribose-phosphate pyrophosphokinase [Bacteroidota bacterium]MDP4289022.1 ribose-phosphate pyrophosphokinase [Bacteroidota bacterium]